MWCGFGVGYGVILIVSVCFVLGWERREFSVCIHGGPPPFMTEMVSLMESW